MRTIPIETRLNPIVLGALIRYIKDEGIHLPRWSKSSAVSWAIGVFVAERMGEKMQSLSEQDLLAELESFGINAPAVVGHKTPVDISPIVFEEAFKKFKESDPLDKQSKKIMQEGGEGIAKAGKSNKGGHKPKGRDTKTR